MNFIEIKTKSSELLEQTRNIIVNNEGREKTANGILEQVNECLKELNEHFSSAPKNEFQSTLGRLTASMSFLVKALDNYRFKIKAQVEAKENLERIREEKRKMITSLQSKTLNNVDQKVEQVKKEVIQEVKHDAEQIIKRGRGRPPKKELVTA